MTQIPLSPPAAPSLSRFGLRETLARLANAAADRIWVLIAALVLGWIGAAVLFGYPGILLPALVAVPCILVTLVTLTRG
ncbi:MAG: hypothetical protein AAFW69_04405 [Pseudomonadota bacterium]